MMQPRSLSSPSSRILLPLPLFNEGPEYHHEKILELNMLVLENYELVSLETKKGKFPHPISLFFVARGFP